MASDGSDERKNFWRLRGPGMPSRSVLLVLLLIAGGIWGFVELAGEVTEGDTHYLDERILLAMRNPDDLADPIGSPVVEQVARDLTALGGMTILTGITLVVTAYFLLVRKPRTALFVVVAIFSGMLASHLLKLGFDRPRPDLVPHAMDTYSTSFPSGHAMMSAVTWLTLSTLVARQHRRIKLKLFLLGVALLMTISAGVTRVYLGVHWPTDVLAGWTGGAVWALMSDRVAAWLGGHHGIEPEEKRMDLASE